MWVKQEPEDFLPKMDTNSDDKIPTQEPENLGAAIDDDELINFASSFVDLPVMNYSQPTATVKNTSNSILQNVMNSVDAAPILSAQNAIKTTPVQPTIAQTSPQCALSNSNKPRHIQLHSQLAGHIAAAQAKTPPVTVNNITALPVFPKNEKPEIPPPVAMVTVPQLQANVQPTTIVTSPLRTATVFTQSTNKVQLVNTTPVVTIAHSTAPSAPG